MLRPVVFLLAMLIFNSQAMARETETTRTEFSQYPAFRQNGAVVEALTDKGLMQEIIVRCPGVSGIVTFSKVERLYCTPDHTCFDRFQSALQRLC